MFVGNAGMVIVFTLVVLVFVSGIIWGESLYALTPHGKRLRASYAGYADGHHFGKWDATRGSVFEAIMANSNYKMNEYKSEKEQQAYHESFQRGLRDAKGELLLTKPLVSWVS